MNFTDLSFLLIPEVAMEADDITKQVNQIMGGKDAPAETKTNDQSEGCFRHYLTACHDGANLYT